MLSHLPEDLQQQAGLARPTFRVDDKCVNVPKIQIQVKKWNIYNLQIFIEKWVQLQGMQSPNSLLVMLLAMCLKDLADHQQQALDCAGLELKLLTVDALGNKLIWKFFKPVLQDIVAMILMVKPDPGKPF